jgi:hypothetical protein
MTVGTVAPGNKRPAWLGFAGGARHDLCTPSEFISPIVYGASRRLLGASQSLSGKQVSAACQNAAQDKNKRFRV